MKIIGFNTKGKQSNKITQDKISKAISLKFKCNKLFSRRNSDKVDNAKGTKNGVKIRRNGKCKRNELAKLFNYFNLWASIKKLKQEI